MIKSNYRCAQADLYVACRYGWRLCQRYLADFTALKAKYTEGYIAEKLEAVETADLLPDFSARYEQYDLARRKYTLSLSLLLGKFDHLLSYVKDAYPPDERDIMYRSCGEGFYAKAKLGNWASVSALLSAVVPFMDKNKTALESSWQTPSVKNNMPADFIAEFKTMQAELVLLNEACQKFDEDGQDNTSEKINANNAIYAALIEMCNDAASVFNTQPQTRDEFNFTNFLNKTRGVRPSGIKGKITDKVTGKPLAGASVCLQNTDKTTTTDKEGRYELTPVEAGKYVVTASIEGFQFFVSDSVTVKTGKFTRVNAELEGVLVGV